MGNEDEDSLDDMNSLVEKIGGKKKDSPSEGQMNVPDTPVAPALPEQPATRTPSSGGGDFSLLMKKLGMANRRDKAAAITPVPASPPAPAGPAHEPE
ncbi:MAG: secretion system protein E, partial [Methanoregula sp.]|nr:secretion system protein E [Methanoregula sp.]